ncbi:hypothetical protein QFZ79_003595 [Arthrobacter sp. V4I6]|uniref:hypothetical protein n=1 Tax=unclassified Arthrobacter TaxID=235627 RepID=UPI00277DE77E|nr:MULTISPECIES: hypothetical protein [unclassified Arthrobacter]MDQ0821221.1 hypothetical protein [Arthrobacter sp. V1I7]MDQ0855484.1 hypothetical protein [Arthrobacter sp. V4I6]
MTEIPDEDQTRRDTQEAARDSLAGDPAREIEPDIEEPQDADRAREAGTGD